MPRAFRQKRPAVHAMLRLWGNLTGVTDMGPVSTVRPSVQTAGTSPSTAGIETGGSAATHGARMERAAAVELQQAVAPASATSRSDGVQGRPVTDRGFAVESAKARVMAAQRAYEMASLVAGYNPLNDPVP